MRTAGDWGHGEGMDVETVLHLARALNNSADLVHDQVLRRLDFLLADVAWHGADAQRFEHDWIEAKRELYRVIDTMHYLAHQAHRNAVAQVEASSG